jgi:hypothetical protein
VGHFQLMNTQLIGIRNEGNESKAAFAVSQGCN